MLEVNLILLAQNFDWKPSKTLNQLGKRFGGEGGIRTPVTLPGKLDFESSAFNRARPPLRFLGVSFALPQTLKKLGEQGSCLAREHASGRWQLVIEAPILT